MHDTEAEAEAQADTEPAAAAGVQAESMSHDGPPKPHGSNVPAAARRSRQPKGEAVEANELNHPCFSATLYALVKQQNPARLCHHGAICDEHYGFSNVVYVLLADQGTAAALLLGYCPDKACTGAAPQHGLSPAWSFG